MKIAYVDKEESVKKATHITSPIHRQIWPTLVIEARVCESLPRPRMMNDANWWLSNFSGEVKLVLLIEVDNETLRLGIWEMLPSRRSRRASQPSATTTPSISRTASLLELSKMDKIEVSRWPPGNLRGDHDWDSGTRLQIKGVYAPLKHWSEVYAKHRGDIYPKRKEIWRQ